MGDTFHGSGSGTNYETTRISNINKVSGRCSSGLNFFSHKSWKQIAALNSGKVGQGTAVHVGCFLLKVAALEALRRFSRARCPFVWSSLQALQVICYPPFKWIQHWYPFRVLVEGMQKLSRPLLVLSIATAFADQSACNDVSSEGNENTRGLNDSPTDVESRSEFPSVQSATDERICDEAPQSLPSNNWLFLLHAELENQGISVPDRINDDELRRFHAAANGDFSSLVLSVKKTIRWRETYRILSREDLETWSTMVFWHGFDVMQQPCLIVRLGLACANLASHKRPHFAQAVVSQVEHGILHLVGQNPQITVVVDCQGLSPLKLPMQMMRSCSALLQDHFPNRLGCLFVIQLPPIARAIAQTFVQILKPTTRHKLKFEGDTYHKVISEFLQVLPSYLGGECQCTRCAKIKESDFSCTEEEINKTQPVLDIYDAQNLPSVDFNPQDDLEMDFNCNRGLRKAVVGMLILWVLIALIGGIYDPASSPFLHP